MAAGIEVIRIGYLRSGEMPIITSNSRQGPDLPPAALAAKFFLRVLSNSPYFFLRADQTHTIGIKHPHTYRTGFHILIFFCQLIIRKQLLTSGLAVLTPAALAANFSSPRTF